MRPKALNYKAMIKTLLNNNSSFNSSQKKLIEKAFWFSKKAHERQLRLSGEPFFVHPYNTALILSRYKLPPEMIVTALLHDVLEDTEVTTEELKSIFGQRISDLVESLTELNLIVDKTREEKKMSSLQRALFASTRDIRVILIKLADKIHNLRTLEYFPASKQIEIAKEALEVYSPLAEKLGLTFFNKEIQDTCFPIANPKICSSMTKKMKEKSIKKKKEMDLLIKKLTPELRKTRIEARFIKRDRNPYQVFQKMTKTFKSLNELYDTVFLVILTDSIPQCYESLGILHSLFKPLPLKFKDFIALPQSSLYQSIHTTVIGPKGKPVKIYIRTNEMEGKCQKGILTLVERHKDMKGRNSLLYRLTEMDMHSLDDSEFMHLLKEDLLEDRIFVFSNEGEMIELPKDSTPVDFAFQLNPSLGKKAMRAIVNGRIVPLWHKLRSGDIIEVIPSSKERRDVTWLGFTKSHKARKEIADMIKEKKPKTGKLETILVNIKFTVSNRVGMLHDVTGAFSSQNLNLVSVSMHSESRTKFTEGTLTIEVTSPKKLEHAIEKLKKTKGVMEVQTSYLM